MKRTLPGFNQPVRSLQYFLRQISAKDSRIPPVIPDGIYGTQTETAVMAFQKVYGLPENGKTDQKTWDKIIEVWEAQEKENGRPSDIALYPIGNTRFSLEDKSTALYAIQGVMLGLTSVFPSLGTLKASGVYDRETAAVVDGLRRWFGMSPGGIDRFFWEQLNRFYEASVMRAANNQSSPESLHK